MVKVGVIGVGHLGRLHARVYSELDSCELAGVYDVDRERAVAVAAEFGGRAFEELGGLVDAVESASIAVPTTSHRDVALACMSRGVNVLVEKPICSTVDEAREMIDLARESGLILQVGHVERFNPAIRAAVTVLEDPRFVEAHRLGIFVPRGTDVAVVLDLMIHDIDLVLSVVDSDVARIEAVGVPVLSSNVDIANARLVFENGCTANVTASRVSREKVRKIRFFQPNAYISVDCLKPRVEVFKKKNVPEELLLRIASGQVEGGLSDVVDYKDLPIDEREPLRLELQSFLDSVRDGVPAPVTGEDGARALRVALEVLEQISRQVGEPRPVS